MPAANYLIMNLVHVMAGICPVLTVDRQIPGKSAPSSLPLIGSAGTVSVAASRPGCAGLSMKAAMKRHESLQELSREHYQALKLVLVVRRAVDSGDLLRIGEAAAACVAAFAAELEPHFQVEERDLLPQLEAAGEAALLQRTRDDHGELRRLAAALPFADAASLQRFADCLNAHVRFEEREMFPAVERIRTPGEAVR